MLNLKPNSLAALLQPQGAARFRAQVAPDQTTFQPQGGLGELLAASGMPNQQTLQQPMPQAMPEKKPGLFSRDGQGWKILGVIGDALQTASGGQGTFMPYMADMNERIAQERARQQELQARAEQAAAERMAKREDWQWQQQNQIPNLQREYEYAKQLDPNLSLEGFLRLKQPSQWVPGEYGGGQYTRPDAQGDAPDELPADFNFGGQTVPPSGGFRP